MFLFPWGVLALSLPLIIAILMRFFRSRREGLLAGSRYHHGMKLQIVLEPSDEGGYTAYVPTLPGCISEGNSRDEALSNIREAIELYLEPVDDDFAATEGLEIAELVV
jgi:predicted RNase H-like HicB family nuclease